MLFSVNIDFLIGFFISATLMLNAVSSSVSTSAQLRDMKSWINGNFLKVEKKLEEFDKRIEQLEQRNSSAGISDAFDAVHEMLTNITRAISNSHDELATKFEHKFNKLEENQKKIEENNFKKMEKFDKNLKKIEEKLITKPTTTKPPTTTTKPPTTTTKPPTTTTQPPTTTTQPPTTTTQPPTTTKSPITVCNPNPCLHGGRCQPISTGSGYKCIDCPKFTSGSRCQKVECTVEKRCWRLNDTLYTAIESRLTWAEAKVKCESLKMTLAMPKDQQRTQFLWDQLGLIYKYPYHALWIGLKREPSGWFWVDGSALGEYTGGWPDMKSTIGPKFGLLDFTDASDMWGWGYANYQWYALCEANLISH